MDLLPGEALITQAGVYDIPAERYHADRLMATPTLSSGCAWSLVEESCKHAWQQHPRFGGDEIERMKKKHLEFGSAVHSMILGSGEEVVEIRADSFRSAAAKEARDAAHARWAIPLLTEDHDEAINVARAGTMQLDCHEDASEAFTDGKPEQTLIWQDGGVWCRARLDWLAKRRTFDDLKTTGGSARPEDWIRSHLFADGNDMQAAFYTRGIRALGLHRDPIFRFIVLETKKPYALSAIAVGEAAMTAAQEKVEMALALWESCLVTGKWPAYEARTAWADLPNFLATRMEERKIQRESKRSAEEYMQT